MAEQVIEIDTAALARPVGRTAWVRIGGQVFEAKCPKDAVLTRIQEDDDNVVDLVRSFMSAMLGSKASIQVNEMLADDDNSEVSIATLFELVKYLMEHPDGPRWANALNESFKNLGSGTKPRTVPVKTAAKKTATKKSAARKR